MKIFGSKGGRNGLDFCTPYSGFSSTLILSGILTFISKLTFLYLCLSENTGYYMTEQGGLIARGHFSLIFFERAIESL